MKEFKPGIQNLQCMCALQCITTAVVQYITLSGLNVARYMGKYGNYVPFSLLESINSC